MNKICQPRNPCNPSRLRRKLDIGDPKSPAAAPPNTKTEVIRPRTEAGHQKLRKRITPGKKPASATPRRKRMIYNWVGLVINAVAPEIRPQRIIIRSKFN